MDYTTGLLTGIAQLVADAGVGVWNPDGTAYTAGQVGIVLRTVPSTPDRIVALFPYSVSDRRILADSTTGVQFRTRGNADPRQVDDLADLLFPLFQDRTQYDLPTGIRVVASWRQSFTGLGQDANRRHERSDNYYFHTSRPAAYRL